MRLRGASSWLRFSVALLLLAMFAALAWVVLGLPAHSAGLQPMVAAQMAVSGVDHPVTAVLLNFRGYDTLLEMAVLLLACLGVWSLSPAVPPSDETPGTMLAALPRHLVPAAGSLILLIEAVAGLSIGVTLMALFLGGEPGESS